MKKLYLVALAALSAAVLGLLGSTTPTMAWSQNLINGGDSVTIEQSAIKPGSVYVAGNNITINATVDGSLYCAGGHITVNGSVHGDINCAGQDITINGSVQGSVKLAGGTLSLGNKVGSDVSLFGQTATVRSNAIVAGDINAGVQNLTIDGTVTRSVVAGVQSLNMNGKVGSMNIVDAQNLSLGKNARVSGDLNYQSEDELKLDSNKIGGAVHYHKPQPRHQVNPLYTLALVFATFAVTALILTLAAPRWVDRSAGIAKAKFGYVMLFGVLGVFTMPVLAVVLAFTVVGLPLALMMILAWLLLLMLSGTFFAYFIGALILPRVANILVRLFVGLVVTAALLVIPYSIGVFSVLIMLIMGTGIILTTLLHNYQPPRYSQPRAGKGAKLDAPQPTTAAATSNTTGSGASPAAVDSASTTDPTPAPEPATATTVVAAATPRKRTTAASKKTTKTTATKASATKAKSTTRKATKKPPAASSTSGDDT